MTTNTNKRSKTPIPPDMWLHVASDALARYVAAGGTITVATATTIDNTPAVLIILPLAIEDPRLAAPFVALAPAPLEQEPA